MKTKYICILFGALIYNGLGAQVKIGDNPNSINASSMLELESTNKGFLPPRISLASLTDITTIPSPATGLLIFNTNAGLSPGKGFFYNSGTSTAAQWVKLVSQSDSIVKTITPAGSVIALARFPMGELSMNSNVTLTNISSAGVWAKVAGTTSFNAGSYEFSSAGTNNRLKYIGTSTKMFHIACTISVKSTSSTSNLKAVIYKNGVALTTGIVQCRMGNSSDIISTAIHVMIDMSTNDYLELWITNTLNGTDYTVTEMNLFAMGVSMGMD